MRWRASVRRAGCHGVIIRRYIGDADHVIRETLGQSAVFRGRANGTVEEFETQFVLPLSLPPGGYTYQPIVKRWCNLLQEHLWPIVTYQPAVAFTVIP